MPAPNPDFASRIQAEPFDAGFRGQVTEARDIAVAALLRERDPQGGWRGELSASALSTATAVTALSIVSRENPATAARLAPVIDRGFRWLIAHQNPDGGWGDTTRSHSNISTTVLVWAAWALRSPADISANDAIVSAERWLRQAAGSIEPRSLVSAIERRYGKDRTFSIPILTMCALCGRLGSGREGWRHVRQLPFEVAALPQCWFGALQLPVVSYALPALIAIGQLRHHMSANSNPFWRWVRDRCAGPTLKKLSRLQPPNGGFLEATPLTSFVTMSLAAMGGSAHPVVERGVAFIEASARPDGSWSIDSDLATWVTTLSVNALITSTGESALSADAAVRVRDWLVRQQLRHQHPYTLAAPGGWAWTDLPGGVPDADDTAGALIALQGLDATHDSVRNAVSAGVNWLIDLQNRDGGIPTFCRGWGKLPFDRSSPDITAHVLRAWTVTRSSLSVDTQRRVDAAIHRAVAFLERGQRPDGAWVPLWFGHQDDPDDENPLYGTARVVPALCQLERAGRTNDSSIVQRAIDWLVSRQSADGGWSGAAGATSSLEETALALEALAFAWDRRDSDTSQREALRASMERGASWLVSAIAGRRWDEPAPIGFYFAKLWYYERLYPLIFATGALVRLSELHHAHLADKPRLCSGM